MTLFHLADASTVNSPTGAPLKVVNIAEVLGSGPLNWAVTEACTFRISGNGNSTCTATFQWVGSNDSALTLPPQGTGGAWDNIGAATTITSNPPSLGSATITSTVPYHRQGVIISGIAGTGAAATALLNV